MSSELIKKMDDLLKTDVVSRHSYFQLKYFLIGKEPTNQAKMWQCLRELKLRKENLKNIILQTAEEEDKLELQEINIIKLNKLKDQETDELAKKELKIKQRQLNRAVEGIKNTITDLEEKQKFIEEECEFFLQTYKNIEKIEPIKNFDDFEAQKEYWGTKLLEKMNLKILLENNIDIDLVETVLSLPDDIPIKQQVLNKLNALQSNMINLQNEYTKKLGASNGKN
jgi:hypothetical protein